MTDPAPKPGLRTRRGRPTLVIGLTLAVFGATLATVNLRLRASLRGQIAGRDASVLNQIAVLQMTASPPGSDGDPNLDLGLPPEMVDPEVAALLRGEQLNELAGRLRGILATRLFDVHGAMLLVLPDLAAPGTLTHGDVERLRQFEPLARYHPAFRLADLLPMPGAAGEGAAPQHPVLEVTIPLRDSTGKRFVGAVQLLLDGHGIQAEYAALDRHLWREGAVLFLGGAVVIVAGLGWAFGRLERANQLLTERSQSLLRANAELALAARTAALGSVTAHLIHGLKNPLTGLHRLVTTTAGLGPDDDSLWREAAQSTRRMQAMVQEVVRVLREEDGTAQYEISAAELVDLLRARVDAAAAERGIRLVTQARAEDALSNRVANLALLVLENLLANALEASPSGSTVALEVSRLDGALVFEVRDEGPGLPPEVQANLFSPVRSTRPGGAGIGLAISRQLARAIGAELALVRTGPSGTCFRLSLSPA